jgi:hypothetical protein
VNGEAEFENRRQQTIVLQSQAPGRDAPWQRACRQSVRAWARRHGYAYRFCGDELFARLPPALRDKFRPQPVVLADLGRLLWMQEVLAEGYGRAIWCDADLVVCRDFTPRDADHLLGREIWIQARDPGPDLQVRRQVHNAWLQFSAADSLLPFYIDRATALLERVQAPVVPQFIGPKLLTALHNILGFSIEERVGMLSPLVQRDLLAGGGPALDAFRAAHAAPPCALNLCASYVDRNSDGVCHTEADYAALVDGLLSGSCAP